MKKLIDLEVKMMIEKGNYNWYEFIEEYTDNLDLKKGTIESYRKILNLFLNWINE